METADSEPGLAGEEERVVAHIMEERREAQDADVTLDDVVVETKHETEECQSPSQVCSMYLTTGTLESEAPPLRWTPPPAAALNESCFFFERRISTS